MSLKIINSSGTEEDFEGDDVPCHCGDCDSCDIETIGIHEYLELKKQRKQRKHY